MLISVKGRGSSITKAKLNVTCNTQTPFLRAGEANEAIRQAGEELAGKPVVLRGLERRSRTDVSAIAEWTSESRQRCTANFDVRLLLPNRLRVTHDRPVCTVSPTSPSLPSGPSSSEKAIANDGCGALGVELLEFHAQECSSGMTFRTAGWPAWSQTTTTTSGTLEFSASLHKVDCRARWRRSIAPRMARVSMPLCSHPRISRSLPVDDQRIGGPQFSVSSRISLTPLGHLRRRSGGPG